MVCCGSSVYSGGAISLTMEVTLGSLSLLTLKRSGPSATTRFPHGCVRRGGQELTANLSSSRLWWIPFTIRPDHVISCSETTTGITAQVVGSSESAPLTAPPVLPVIVSSQATIQLLEL